MGREDAKSTYSGGAIVQNAVMRNGGVPKVPLGESYYDIIKASKNQKKRENKERGPLGARGAASIRKPLIILTYLSSLTISVRALRLTKEYINPLKYLIGSSINTMLDFQVYQVFLSRKAIKIQLCAAKDGIAY